MLLGTDRCRHRDCGQIGKLFIYRSRMETTRTKIREPHVVPCFVPGDQGTSKVPFKLRGRSRFLIHPLNHSFFHYRRIRSSVLQSVLYKPRDIFDSMVELYTDSKNLWAWGWVV